MEEKKRPKTGGRKKGSKNKTTLEIKQALTVFVGESLDDIIKEFKKLQPKEKLEHVDTIARLLPYVVAKQTETKVAFDDELSKKMLDAMDKVNNAFDQ